ncbi:MAG: CRTAC1 family protein, partial [Chitinophagaceae bacterium]|nr:CRTAC1 family protein [Chitinophagaceae bacterium]
YLDFDNDGLEDILAGGLTADNKRGLRLLHNEGAKGFSDVTEMLPPELQTQQLALADFNMDGDDDIFLTGPGGLKLIRNDGGSLNHYTQVQLVGFSYGNSKNNRLGIGAQVELKAGDLYQTKTVRRMTTNFGVGNRDSLDAVRIIWPNGSPQYISDPSRRQKLFEESKLKGSCPFLFVWDGQSYAFFKDMMWRSALGMPLAVNGKDTTYAFSDRSQEYLLIPGERIKLKNNHYSIKITEELWETVFFDKLALYAVDHPDSVEVFADERFVAPPFPGKEVHVVEKKQYPVSVTDGQGTNLLSKIKTYDFQYISNFNLTRYQGLAEPHDLILDLGSVSDANKLLLFLRGWIFPTDASINSAFTQSSKYRVKAPELQVINAKGEWQTVIPNMGFPMGKDKMVKVDLTHKFLTAHDRRIRIRTNMQIYWDEIFFSSGQSTAPVKMHDIPIAKAALNFRGYSEMYRKGGPFGPHWFDYDQVSQGQQWRDLTGNYTRYGDVLPLLGEADDEYIIANSGDEVTVDFDAAALPRLPAEWKRDFLIYSEGWVKDGDLNTAHGQTVEPLPFHAMPSYPYPQNVKYPSEKHKAYMDKYNTRKVTTDSFKSALKP